MAKPLAGLRVLELANPRWPLRTTARRGAKDTGRKPYGSNAEILVTVAYVRFGSLADIALHPSDVCFILKSRHSFTEPRFGE